jgi:hypothetical protein
MLSVVYADCPLCWVFQISAYAECRYAECDYAECRYAECHYAKCCGATNSVILKGTLEYKFDDGLK